MSIGGIAQSSLSALQSNQLALRTVSANVANLNTDGYARQETYFQANAFGQGTVGVTTRIEQAVDQFLQSAHLRSAATQSGAEIQATWLDRAQALLGDPDGQGTIFGALDEAYSALAALPAEPASASRKAELVEAVSRLLDRIETAANGITQLRHEARTRIENSTQEINTLLQGIASLNSTIIAAGQGQGEAAAAQTEQAALIDRLSQLLDIRTQARPLGGLQIRTQSGLILADTQAASLNFETTQSGASDLFVRLPQSDNPVALSRHIRGGELAGLIALDGRALPELAAAIGGFAAGVADSFNRGHNQAWPVPAPQSLTGHATGWLGSDAIGFSGIARLGLVDAQGRLSETLTLDFDAGIISHTNGQQWNIGTNLNDFTTALNTALGNAGSAAFSGGRLSLQTVSGGLVIEQDASRPAGRAGRGFSESFGLNNLIESDRPVSHATGLSASDAHGFTPGQTLQFAIRDDKGRLTATRNFTITGTNVSDLVNGLNTALAGYAVGSLDANGRLALTPVGQSNGAFEIISDPTLRGDTGRSFSQIFGTGQQAQAQRATALRLRPDIKADPSRLGTAAPELAGATPGTLVLAAGDSRGALLMETASSASLGFPAAGALKGQNATLSDYGAALAAHIGQRARTAESEANIASAMHSDIHDRRQSAQGVNLDEELVKMTTYQQAYAAASRMMQASQELYETLLQII